MSEEAATIRAVLEAAGLPLLLPEHVVVYANEPNRAEGHDDDGRVYAPFDRSASSERPGYCLACYARIRCGWEVYRERRFLGYLCAEHVEWIPWHARTEQLPLPLEAAS